MRPAQNAAPLPRKTIPDGCLALGLPRRDRYLLITDVRFRKASIYENGRVGDDPLGTELLVRYGLDERVAQLAKVDVSEWRKSLHTCRLSLLSKPHANPRSITFDTIHSRGVTSHGPPAPNVNLPGEKGNQIAYRKPPWYIQQQAKPMQPNDTLDVAASGERTADSLGADSNKSFAAIAPTEYPSDTPVPVEATSSLLPLPQEPSFDFETHRRTAVDEYAKVRPLYEEFSRTIVNILTEALTRRSVKVHSIQGRAKELESFGQKVMRHSDVEPEIPKYSDPMKQITHLAAARVITFFPRTTDEIERCLTAEFVIAEKVDHTAQLLQEERLGYQSVHYLVRMKEDRTRLPEYERFSGLIGEVQVRTVLQHAWAEIEHDIQYKSPTSIPVAIRRRFMAVAGMLEIIDREFQAIQDADSELKERARKSVQHGDLDRVEITADALQAYLDKRLGADARVADWSYNWMVRVLLRLGFRNFKQVDECIRGYDDDRVSRAMHGARQGQITRFEDMLLAGMGENFIRNHPTAQEDWFAASRYLRLGKLKQAGIQIGSYSTGVSSLRQRPLTQTGI